MSVKDNKIYIDVQDGTTGKNRCVIDYDEFSYELYDPCHTSIDITTNLTLGEFLLFSELRRCLVNDKHDCFIKLGYKN